MNSSSRLNDETPRYKQQRQSTYNIERYYQAYSDLGHVLSKYDDMGFYGLYMQDKVRYVQSFFSDKPHFQILCQIFDDYLYSLRLEIVLFQTVFFKIVGSKIHSTMVRPHHLVYQVPLTHSPKTPFSSRCLD